MDLEYFVEPVFKIDFLKIKCNDWKNKKTNLKTTMDQFPSHDPFFNSSPIISVAKYSFLPISAN